MPCSEGDRGYGDVAYSVASGSCAPDALSMTARPPSVALPGFRLRARDPLFAHLEQSVGAQSPEAFGAQLRLARAALRRRHGLARDGDPHTVGGDLGDGGPGAGLGGGGGGARPRVPVSSASAASARSVSAAGGSQTETSRATRSEPSVSLRSVPAASRSFGMTTRTSPGVRRNV